MSMILGLHTISNEDLERLLLDPPLVWAVVAPEDPELYEAARQPATRPGLLAGLLGRRPPARPQPPPEPPRIESEERDLDKAWHGIHFLLTGAAWGGEPPLDFLVQGGTEIGDIDVGYGPVRAFRPDQVAAIGEHLGRVSPEELRRRFDPVALSANEVYPSIWDREEDREETLGYLVEYFEVLRAVVDGAATRGLGLLISLT